MEPNYARTGALLSEDTRVYAGVSQLWNAGATAALGGIARVVRVEHLHVSSMSRPVSEKEAREAALSIVPVAVDVDGNVLAGHRRLAVAIALGWDEIDVRVFEDLQHPALLAAIAFEQAQGVGVPPLSTQVEYLENTVRPQFEEERARTWAATGAASAAARTRTVPSKTAVNDVADVDTEDVGLPDEGLRAEAVDGVGDFPTPSPSGESDEIVLGDSESEGSAFEGPGSWRDQVEAHLIGYSYKQAEQYMRMRKWVADERLTDRDRARIQSSIDAIDKGVGSFDSNWKAAKSVYERATAPADLVAFAAHAKRMREFTDPINQLAIYFHHTTPEAVARDIIHSAPDLEGWPDLVNRFYEISDQIEAIGKYVMKPDTLPETADGAGSSGVSAA